jgi:hypothetical protein
MARPGNRIPTVTLYADKKEVETAFRIATKGHLCLHCNTEFSLLESMGALECLQHPGFLQDNEKWSCCGQKEHTPRWSADRPFLQIYDNRHQPFKCANVRGCQKCDHNTSDRPFTHKDAQGIAELSAILPFINKEYPFILRPGFDQGVLRRCGRRNIIVPAMADKVTYQNNDGYISQYSARSDEPVPQGIEISALDLDGQPITEWIK